MAYEFKGRTQARVEAERGRRRPTRSEAPAETRAPRPPRTGRTPMQAFAALFGAAFLLLGVAGFIPGLTRNYDRLELWGPDSEAELLGLFEVSILHNLVHLLFAVGLLAAARYSWARLYLLVGGVAYLGVVVYGALVEKESDANFLPINDADNTLHLVLAVAMIALGLVGTRLSAARA